MISTCCEVIYFSYDEWEAKNGEPIYTEHCDVYKVVKIKGEYKIESVEEKEAEEIIKKNNSSFDRRHKLYLHRHFDFENLAECFSICKMLKDYNKWETRKGEVFCMKDQGFKKISYKALRIPNAEYIEAWKNKD